MSIAKIRVFGMVLVLIIVFTAIGVHIINVNNTIEDAVVSNTTESVESVYEMSAAWLDYVYSNPEVIMEMEEAYQSVWGESC